MVVATNRRFSSAPGCAVPAALNCALAVGHAALNLHQFFFLPLVLLPASSWWGLTIVPAALMSNSFWSLIHEAIHGHFHARRAPIILPGAFCRSFSGARSCCCG
jgi:hypothetical protein